QHPGLETTDGDAPLVIVVRRRRHEQLRRAVRIDVRRRDLIDDRLEQRLERRADVAMVDPGLTGDRIRVDRPEFSLLLARAWIEEEVERLIQYIHRSSLR